MENKSGAAVLHMEWEWRPRIIQHSLSLSDLYLSYFISVLRDKLEPWVQWCVSETPLAGEYASLTTQQPHLRWIIMDVDTLRKWL